MSELPMINIKDIDLIDHFPGYDEFSGPIPERARGGRWGKVGQSLGSRKLGCSLTVVPPGKVMFPYHIHHANEEMVHVVLGKGTVRYEDEEFAIREGDIILFPIGSAHQIRNTSDSELRYLVFSTLVFPEVCEYPDSEKISAMPEPERSRFHITYKQDRRPYWESETLDRK